MSAIESLIKTHLANLPLDLRASRNGRWMDQKVTPDVLSFIADATLNLDPAIATTGFTKNDIWASPYFHKNMKSLFNKPDTTEASARREYDKLSGQPLRTLAYAGVLKLTQASNRNVYSIADEPLLTYVALSSQKAHYFLTVYIDQVLRQSGFGAHLDAYLTSNHDRQAMAQLKSKFKTFTLANTGISKDYEPARIFPKVINPIAVDRDIPGISGGYASKHPFVYSDLMYNQKNWRDRNKAKSQTRQQRASVEPTAEFSAYEMQKAMDAVKRLHAPDSEVHDRLGNEEATQVHHIFPKSTFPMLRATPENLILLTAQQHNSRAHPSNKTSQIDPSYQIDCLIAKIRTVRNAPVSDTFYSEDGMRFVLQTGLQMDVENLGWDAILEKLSALRRG